uniref:Keratin n=1 Tax=Cyprinodon variegatus TaxID=28743 RepID=A0A3Q2GH34_CYPVA
GLFYQQLIASLAPVCTTNLLPVQTVCKCVNDSVCPPVACSSVCPPAACSSVCPPAGCSSVCLPVACSSICPPAGCSSVCPPVGCSSACLYRPSNPAVILPSASLAPLIMIRSNKIHPTQFLQQKFVEIMLFFLDVADNLRNVFGMLR